MKTTGAILITLCLLLGGWQTDLHAQARVETATQGSIALKWLGTSGWEIQISQTVILIDPFLSRREPSLTEEWKTDEEAVLKAIKRADYIFAGHSHRDHIADVPFIAKKFGSKVIGSRTTTNIALTAGVDKSQLITISGGEKFDFKEFSVQVVESEHGTLVRSGHRRRPKFEEVTKPWSGPIMGDAFVEGGCYLYYFTFGNLHLLHQSTGGFIEDKIAGLRTDVALLYPMASDDLAKMLKPLQPKTVFANHFDRQFMPFSEGITDQTLTRTRKFAQNIGDIDKNIKVVIPKYFETYTLN